MDDNYEIETITSAALPGVRVASWSGEPKNRRGASVLRLLGNGMVFVEHLWVEPNNADQGVASALVSFALRSIEDVKFVQATPEIAEQEGLFNRLREEFPELTFEYR